MNRRKALSFAISLAALAVASCSGFKNVVTCPGGNCGGSATVSFTLVADTLPANPSILSFKVSITGIQLTPAAGSAITLTPATPVVDLMRLQSDGAFLGSLASVPAGTYTVTVSLSTPASGSTITFFNDTTSNITNTSPTPCVPGAVCTATLTANGNPTIASFTLTVTSSVNQGIGLNFNLKNAISISNGTLTANFNPAAPSPGVLTAFTLPRQNANLGANQLELIEDFTGVVSLSGNNVTITSLTRGPLAATAVAATNFDPDPSGTFCPRPTTTLSGCVSSNQVASMDAVLNSDGTFSIREIEPLATTQQDFVEGTVYLISGQTQFGIVVTDKIQTATNSLVGGLNTGDLLTVNIPSPQPFFVDTKGLAVPAASLGLFQGQSNTTAIHPGQNVAIHITAFTAANGATLASATADTVTLRWSRLIAGLTSASTTTVNVNAVPSYFGVTPASGFPTQVFSGTLGADGITNLDGVTDAGSLNSGLPIGLRVLYLENSTNSAQFPFMAAKIRQH